MTRGSLIYALKFKPAQTRSCALSGALIKKTTNIFLFEHFSQIILRNNQYKYNSAWMGKFQTWMEPNGSSITCPMYRNRIINRQSQFSFTVPFKVLKM